MSENKIDCEHCAKKFTKENMCGDICKGCNDSTQICNNCECRVDKKHIKNGECEECASKVLCKGTCNTKFDSKDLLNGKCDSCRELDSTPTSTLCELCSNNPAIRYTGGKNLCDDCDDHYHY